MKIGVDIDGTLTNETKGWDYENRTPNIPMIEWVNKHYDEGDFIELFTARLGIDKKTTKEWLKKHGVKYNNLVFNKPKYDLYVGDEVKRPEEVLKLVKECTTCGRYEDCRVKIPITLYGNSCWKSKE